LNNINYIKDSVHNGELRRSQLAAKDVLMTITGRVGTAAVVTEDDLPANINQHIVRMRIQREDCLPEYLSVYLNSSIGTALSNRGVTGGTRIALDYEVIRKIQIPLPSLEIQRTISAELSLRRAQARRLRQEAEHEWQSAKEKFEKALLG
jgi:type I restriction enzyme S subunit